MGARGFTLVEVLVALAIFALIAAGGTSLIAFSADTQAAVGARMESLARLERTRAQLAADLSQLADRPTRGLDGLSLPAFIARGGAENGVKLIVVRRGWENPDGRPRASLHYVEYALTDGRLERRARSAVDGAPLGPAAILMEDISGFEIAAWRGDRWEPLSGGFQGSPPSALQVVLTTADHGPVRLATLTGAPG